MLRLLEFPPSSLLPPKDCSRAAPSGTHSPVPQLCVAVGPSPSVHGGFPVDIQSRTCWMGWFGGGGLGTGVAPVGLHHLLPYCPFWSWLVAQTALDWQAVWRQMPGDVKEAFLRLSTLPRARELRWWRLASCPGGEGLQPGGSCQDLLSRGASLQMRCPSYTLPPTPHMSPRGASWHNFIHHSGWTRKDQRHDGWTHPGEQESLHLNEGREAPTGPGLWALLFPHVLRHEGPQKPPRPAPPPLGPVDLRDFPEATTPPLSMETHFPQPCPVCWKCSLGRKT